MFILVSLYNSLSYPTLLFYSKPLLYFLLGSDYADVRTILFLGEEISSVNEERDKGVFITADLKSSAQCIDTEQKVQKILGYVKRV